MNRTLSLLIALALVAGSAAPLDALAAKKSASFAGSSLTSTRTQPTVTGSANGYKSVYLTVSDAKGKLAFRSDVVRTKNDAFSIKVKKDLKPGVYTVRLYDKGRKFLTKSVLTVLSESAGSVVVTGVPLLMGGVAQRGGTIPVAYLQVRNGSSATTTLKGVDLVENGPGTGVGITGFMVNDDLGGSRTTIGSPMGGSQFTDEKAFVPLTASIPPRTTRIFTVKAIVGANPGADRGKILMIDVANVHADGAVSGRFPIAGTAISIAP